MRCREARPILESYLAGELPGSHAVALERHLEACPACRKEMEVTQRLVSGLRSSFRVAIPPRSLSLPTLAVQPQRLAWFPKVASIAILSALLLGLIVVPSIHPYGRQIPAASFQTSPTPAHENQPREVAEVINRHGTDWRISIN